MAKMALMGNNPYQHSSVTRKELNEISANLMDILASSPDLNPIESVFHNLKCELQLQALNRRITKEVYSEFNERTTSELVSLEIKVIMRTILTRPRQLRYNF